MMAVAVGAGGCGAWARTWGESMRLKTLRTKSWGARWLAGGMGLVYGLLLAAGVAGFSGDAYALRVTIKRVVFEGSKRADMIVLINNTDEEMVYRLGWRRMRMGEDNSVRPVAADDPATDLRPAEEMIKYAPRRVVLPPGGSQQVRLMLRRPKDLPDGEYRSHFWIEPEDIATKFSTDQAPPADGPAVQIRMLTGITLPVIVRVGDLKATGALSGGTARRTGDGVQVGMVLSREGNRSLFGDLEFACGETVVQQLRGIAVYTEVTKRNLSFVVPAVPVDCGALTVTYRAPDDDRAFPGGVIAQTTIAVP